MPQLHFERHVPFTPDQMIALVADVARYPEFVPNCTGTALTLDPKAPDTHFAARMDVEFGPFNQSYVSDVTIDRPAGTVRALSSDGPFKRLDNLWTFTPDGQGTKVDFALDFAFASPLVAAMADPIFAKKQEEIMDAFIARATTLYG